MKPILILTAFFILSCNAEKQFAKKEKHAKEFYQTHPELLAGFCDDEFPVPEVEYIPGDTIIKHESIIHPGVYLPCPDPTPENPNPTVKCPDCKEITKVITKTDTIRFKDLKDVQLYNESQKEIKSLQSKINALELENKDLKNGRNNWRWAFIVLAVICGAFVGFKVIK